MSDKDGNKEELADKHTEELEKKIQVQLEEIIALKESICGSIDLHLP